MDAKATERVGSDGKVPGAIRKLGRGLGSLIPTPPTAVGVPTTAGPQSESLASGTLVSRGTASSVTLSGMGSAPANGSVQEIPVGSIVPNRHQPRETFNDASIAELAESIRSAGLLQPILVRPINASDGVARFEIIAGERRWRAVRSLGHPTIQAIVRSASDRESAQFAIIENLQRDDLNPAERAFAVRALVEEFDLSHQQVAEALGIDRPTVSNLIRLTELDGRSLDLVRVGKLTAGHARALLGIRDTSIRSLLADTAVMEEWSVRTLEREVQRAVDRAKGSTVPRGTSTPPMRSAHISSLEDKLTRALGTRVQLQLGRRKGTGKMTIEFFSLEQFDGLIARFGVEGAGI